MRNTPIALLALALVACTSSDLRERMDAAGVFSPSQTDAGRERVVELGRLLFFDRELSGNRNTACASCHMPFHHAQDELSLGRGQGASGLGHARTGGPGLPRNTIAPFNRSFADSLLWDGRVERLPDGSIRAPVPLPEGVDTLLEAQALLPLLDREEMRGEVGDRDVRGAENELAAFGDDAPEAIWAAIMARLMALPDYRRFFADAFPGTPEGEHDISHAVEAIARFEMHLWELTDTPFDAYLGSEHREPIEEALQGDALAGADLFFGDAGCDRCHSGPLLSDDAFHNIGVPHVGPGKERGLDEGRFLVTRDPLDRFAFRTPPLRNVAMTAPYMHNGSVVGLEAAIRVHLDPRSALAGPALGPDGVHVEVDPAVSAEIAQTLDADAAPLRPLVDAEIAQLVAFLQQLTSETELRIFPGAGEPASVPSGLEVDRVID